MTLYKHNNQKKNLVMRAFAMALFMAFFTQLAQAQTEVLRMTNGSVQVPDNGYLFYDSGGPLLFDPVSQPQQAEEFNWTTWYQHNENYTLTLVNNSGGGIEIEFELIRVNNDTLSFYDGDAVDETHLIGSFCNNEYSSAFCDGEHKIKVVSHGKMTIHFVSDYHWGDQGWIAKVFKRTVAQYEPQPPVAALAACDNQMVLIPTCWDENGRQLEYQIGSGSFITYAEGTWVDLNSQTFDLTVTTRTQIGENYSGTKAFTFSSIKVPGEPEGRPDFSSNTVTAYFPDKPEGVNDTYYVRWVINKNSNGANENPSVWPNSQEFQQPNNTPNSVPAGVINYTNAGITPPFYVHLATRGTTCPDIFSEVETITVEKIYVPKPTITFVTNSNNTGGTTMTCSLTGATIYYTIDGSEPDPEHVGGANPTTAYTTGSTIIVSAGTTVKAIAVKSGFTNSDIASEIFIPGAESGNSQNGVYGDIVLLDDREDHSWSYYSDGDQPIHSLNPADVKITYFGNGVGTVTNASENDVTPTSFSLDATTVAVSGYESANQFIYLKTLENANEAGSGNYPYTLIPNPFSKRPTVGTISTSAGATCWRGFYGWRVKRLSGVTITGYSVGDIIPAETEIEFVTSNAEGNEVEFEAMWAQAWFATAVNNTSNLNANVTYERNFIRIAGQINTTNSRPATIMELYPNGTTDGTIAATAAPNTSRNLTGYSLSADTKFEFIALNRNSGTMTANNHYLCFGRGINASRNAAHVQGISGNVNSDLSYTMRVESGRYDLLAYVAEVNCTVSGRVQVKAIMGSDYDRAKTDNSLLSVSRENNLFFTRDVAFSNVSNKDQKVFDLVVKSGEYQKNYWTNTGDQTGFTYTHSMYCGANFGSSSNNAHYPGVRYVTIEGGALGNINGGRGTRADGNNNNPGATTPGTDAKKVSFSLRIKKDAVINGCVFGGAANTSAWGSKRIVVTGGEVLSWIAGGANGTNTTTGDSRTRGASYIYVGGNAKVGGPNAIRRNGTYGGQVFGAGRGNQNQAASMDSSYVVIADNAQILRKESEASGNVYGGGNIGYIAHKSNVYILGGTVGGSVYGGAYGNALVIPTSNVYVEGGTVNGSVYGGSNSSGTVTDSHVTMTGGETKNVFGGGFGSSTIIGHSTTVKIGGGSLKYNLKSDSTTDYENGNVYGGGDAGVVNGNTDVSVSGGTLYNVYGAGKGGTNITALISGQTKVNISGGTIFNVYGGGEAGNVEVASGTASTVTIQGGTINEDVFGGGRLGKTQGNVVVNVLNGSNITGSVYGGAFGKRGTTTGGVYQPSVYIQGTHTVNITGGNIYTNVYGGSRNADDALQFNPNPLTDDMAAAVNHVHVSGGHVYYQVFAGGYFGHTYGSVYAYVGQNAINNAPYHAPTPGVSYSAAALLIDGSVWAGADFGNFDGYEFGDATIEGRSNIYIDGTGYNTISTKPSDAGYMNIGSSVLGSGTSCYAGLMGSDLIFRNYGQPTQNPDYSKDAIIEPYTSATRHLLSIQFFKFIDIDNTHLHFIGQGRINSLMSTEKYSVYDIKEAMRMVNGSSFFIDFPADQVKMLGSYTCTNVYANSPTYTVVNYSDLKPNNGKDNKFRVNEGSYLNIKYIGAYNPNASTTGYDYGELKGFFFMMTDDENHTCAYARPKQSTDQGNTIPDAYHNPNDGGFKSYHDDKNTFDEQGGTASPGIQMPYENHTLMTKYGELYFRIWRYGGIYSYRQGIFDAVASTTEGYSTADVVISLPAQHGTNSFFRIKVENEFPMIDYGDDVLTVNAGVYNSTDGVPAADGWMNYNVATNQFVGGQAVDDMGTTLKPLTDNPNVNFGLVAIPQGSLAGGTNTNWLICNDASDSGEALTTNTWVNNDNVNNPSILFRLTYNNALTNNATWDPITIIFEQCTVVDGNVTVTDEIEIALSVSTVTTINQDFSTQVFAMMNGQSNNQASTYTAKVVLPGFIPFVNTEGDLSNWTFVDAEWHGESGYENAWKSGSGYVHNDNPANDEFSMQIVPAANFDNTVGWNSYANTTWDLNYLHTNHQTPHLAFTDGRNNTAFDFILWYDGRAHCDDAKEKLGELVVTLHFTNLASSTATDHGRDLKITIEVFRRGVGNNYYLDGVNGNNFFEGDRPDAAKYTLSGIFNRTEYTPGDNIFVVNTVTAEGATALDWNGEQFGQVIIYRYPGGHKLKKYDDGTQPDIDYYGGYHTDYNPENKGFAGTLVDVKKSMNIHGIVLDGAYNIAYGNPNENLAPSPDVNYRVPTAPLININNEGVLNLYSNSKLQWNYTNSNGGAVYNAGLMIIRNGSDIMNNKLLASTYNGGGVYVKEGATLIVSDSITINKNLRIVNSNDKNSNVYLDGKNSVIQVGTINPSDGITALANHLTDGTSRKSACIGVTKNAWPDYSYNPIAYSDGDGNNYLGNIIPANPDDAAASDYLIFDDDLYYKLVTLNNTPGYEPSTDYLFWVGTWVTYVREKPEGFEPTNIDSPEDLAWAISYVNGLNNSPAHYGATLDVTADIDMNANIWVPIGTQTHPYTGTFNAHGHVIKGVKSSLNDENMAMFGSINNRARISDMILNVNFTGGNSLRMGSVVAEMQNGTIMNVETAGTINGTSSTTDIGGLVGYKQAGTIQSSFAVNTLSATSPNTNMGGLVGYNTGNLFNSYSCVTMNGNANIGGLAGVNNGIIENCYAIMGRQAYPAFAYQNDRDIQLCYADQDNGYVANGNKPKGHGLYDAEVMGRKDLGYMYHDNSITLEDGESNNYVTDRIIYDEDGTRIEMWNGLLSTLNGWVNTHPGYTPWFRPTSANINGDLPVLAFPSDNSLATTNGKFLHYSSTYNGKNGIDALLTTYNDDNTGTAEPDAYLFLYGNATNVNKVPANNVDVFINEDACLLQAAGSGNFGNTTVGITFDNSWKQAHAYPGGNEAPALTYDWHMMATPLRDAKIGATYTHADGDTYTPDAGDNVVWQESIADIGSLTDSYFPNGLLSQSSVTWDFYSFFEPEYHWINLKRNKNNHFHQDSYEDVIQEGIPYQVDQMGSNFKHYQINYTELDQSSTTTGDDACVFIPGKGYMMAISQDSYMSSTGTLNNGSANITVPLTMQSIQDNERGCNLLGNPYQAYLDMSAFCNQNTNLGSSYWVYIAEADNYVAGNCTASTNYALPSATLHPHQAFFVKTNTDGVNAVFNYDMATASPVGYSYFRSDRIDYPLVNLFALNEQGNKDLAVIEMNRPVLDGSPKMRTLNNANFELYTRSNGQDYSILFTEEGTERVAVGFKAKEDGTYTLKWDTQNGQFKYLQLIDNITGAERDMLATDHYTFEAHATDLTTRFYVVFKVDNGEDDMGDTFAFFNGNEWVINGKGTLQLIDVTGRILYSKNLSGETYSRAHFDNFVAGVYMLRLVENNNSIKSQKIIIE